MNPLFSEYLSPTNPIASVIVTALQILFFLWLIGLIIYWLWLSARKRQISKNEDVQPLVDARQKRDPGREENQRTELAETTFNEFCKGQSSSESTPVAKHLKAIFLSGWTESHLEVGELINHTTSNLFRWNNLLRSVLAIFIVIGLLGTLFGLTDSLTQLSPALKASTIDQTAAENSENMTQALSVLLDEMKGALAPSIWGIFFTVLGIIFYNVYLQFACQPVKSTLEQLTLTTWIPQLYPTASQQLTQSGYQTATQVGKLVETVKSNISDLENNISNFDQSLNRADEITQPLSHSVSQINAVADVLNEAFAQKLSEFLPQFTEKVTHLTSFQVEIHNLYQQLKDESDTFQSGANQRLDKQTQTLDEQTQNFVKTLKSLKDYEEVYIASWQQIGETLEKFLNKATETNTNINTTNREFLKNIKDTNHEGLEEFRRTVTVINNNINTTNIEFLENTRDTNRETLEQFRYIFAEINDSINTSSLEFLESIKDTTDEMLEEFRRTITTTNENINTTNIEFLENINTTNHAWIKEIQDQLRTDIAVLQPALNEISETLEKKLEDLTNQLKFFQLPIEKTADQIEGIIESFVRFMRSTVSDLQVEMKKQNENYEDQLKAVKDLNQQIMIRLDKLNKNSENQGIAVEALDSTVGSLSEDTKELTGAIHSFTSDSGALSESIKAIEKHAKTLGGAADELVKKADVTPLTTNIGKLSESISEISQHSQTLATAAENLAQQTSSSNGNPSDEIRKLPFLKKVWNSLLRKKGS